LVIASFKIRPTKRARLYYNVKIFDTCAEMYDYSQNGREFKEGRYLPSPNCGGLCSSWYNPNKPYECGEVLLSKEELGARVVVHELSHAMFGFKRRKQIGDLEIDENGNINASAEEWSVDAIAFMVDKTYHEINKLCL
jgi:hypothetical protein